MRWIGLVLITLMLSSSIVIAQQTDDESVLSRRFNAEFVAGFAIDGGVPNVALLHDDNGDPVVELLYLNEGLFRTQSRDGINFENSATRFSALEMLFRPFGVIPTDVIARETEAGTVRYFFKGLPPPQAGDQRYLYGAEQRIDGTLQLLNNGEPLYSGSSETSNRVEVIDMIETLEGDWRMFYIALGEIPGLAETAISTDEGLTWTFEARNPFNNDEVNPRAQDIDVDPAPFRLNDGTYMAVTMRGGNLFFWNSTDGLTFVPVEDYRVTPQGAGEYTDSEINGLFDPTLVQLPDDTLYMYVTAGVDTRGQILLAEITIID